MIVERLLWHRPADDADAPWWSAAALHFIYDRRLRTHYDLIRRAAEDEDPLVRETTELLLGRIGGGVIDR